MSDWAAIQVALFMMRANLRVEERVRTDEGEKCEPAPRSPQAPSQGEDR